MTACKKGIMITGRHPMSLCYELEPHNATITNRKSDSNKNLPLVTNMHFLHTLTYLTGIFKLWTSEVTRFFLSSERGGSYF